MCGKIRRVGIGGLAPRLGLFLLDGVRGRSGCQVVKRDAKACSNICFVFVIRARMQFDIVRVLFEFFDRCSIEAGAVELNAHDIYSLV
jgi:hypothetical protein